MIVYCTFHLIGSAARNSAICAVTLGSGAIDTKVFIAIIQAIVSKVTQHSVRNSLHANL